MEIKIWEKDNSYVQVPYSMVKGKTRSQLIKLGKIYHFGGRPLHAAIFGKEFPPDKVLYCRRIVHIPEESLLSLTSQQLKDKYGVSGHIVCDRKWKLKKRMQRFGIATVPARTALPQPPMAPEVSFRLDGNYRGETALGAIAAGAGPDCFSLQLLSSAQQEAAADGERPAGAALPSLVARLASLPLCVLERCIKRLGKVEQEVEATQVRVAAAQVAEAHARRTAAQQRVLFYNICLWQRSYPFDVVTCALELYRSQPHLFPPLGPALLRQLHDMMADLASTTHPRWAALPWLPRCDVLLTFPQLPAEEQLQLVLSSGPGAEVLAGPYRGAAPEVLLRGYLPAADIPSRYADEIGEETYRALRRAFECHKVDGVRRLLRRAYGGGGGGNASEAQKESVLQ